MRSTTLPSATLRGLTRIAVTALVLLSLVAALTACGAKSDPLRAETEGDYVRVGHLKYQVQLSRQLNATAAEDAQYLEGVTDLGLTGRQAWFAVWVRVENPSGSPRQVADAFKIEDTQGHAYAPVVPGPSNQYAYRAAQIPAGGQFPDMQSHAFNSPPEGALLLFKVDVASYDDRPLELSITDPGSGQTGHVALDV